MALSSPLSIGNTIKLPSGYAMPQLGLGVYRNTGPAVVTACLAAFEAGYRHVDSAQMYRNEKEVAEAVVRSGLRREEVFITTKIISRDHASVVPAIARSLAQFSLSDTDSFEFGYIDLVLIHDPNCGPENRLRMWRDLLQARDAGLVRTVGVSNFGVRHLQEIVDAGLELPAVNQVELHPFCQQKEIVQWCVERGAVIQAYCPLLRGKRWDSPVLEGLAEKYGKEVGQVLLRWSLQKGFSPLPKSAQPHRVKSNADLNGFALSEEEMQAMDALDEGDNGALSWNPIRAE